MPRFVAQQGLAALSMSALLLAATAHGQQTPKKADSEQSVDRAEGVILRVEPVTRGGPPTKQEIDPNRVKITVNTAAVWRDYTRDTANLSGKPNAKEGENSVALKGQPESANSEIIAEVGPDTTLVLRYRSSTDDISDGETTVEKAEKPGLPETEKPAKKTESAKGDKAPTMKVGDLKPGQFVEVEASNGKASKVTVLKPVGGPETPANEAAPDKKAAK